MWGDVCTGGQKKINIYTDIGIKQVKLNDQKVRHVRDERQK